MTVFPVLSLDNIHKDWLGDPGASLESEAVSAQMRANPRIQKRLLSGILREQDVSPDWANGVEARDVAAAKRLYADLSGFTVKIGLVLYANYLAGIVDRGALLKLSEQFDIEDLRRAVRLRELAPYDDRANFDRTRFVDIVESSGSLCVLAWAMGLPKGLGRQIKLLFPRQMSEDAEIFRQQVPACGDIVRAVSAHMP